MRVRIIRSPPMTLKLIAKRLAIAIGRQILEARVFTNESHVNGANRPVTLLTDDELRNALVIWVVRVIHLIPVNEGNDVRILLDRARLPQIRHHGALVGALFERAVKLRKRHDRAVELLCQTFQRA